MVQIIRPFFGIAVTASLALSSGCGGRAADPVPIYKYGDDELSCNGLRAEMSLVEAEVRALLPESKKTGKNAALGAAGLFLLFPWFFIDLGDAEKLEIKAYNDRYLALEKLFKEKCTSTEQPAPETTAKSRLESLKQLLKDNLISEQEYEDRRSKILDEL